MTPIDPGSKVVLATEGELLQMQGCLLRMKVTGHDTGGAYALMESVALPGAGDPLHIHAEEDEALYVLEGEIDVQIDGRSSRLGAGAYVYLPRQTLHSHKVVGSTPARLLITVSPAGLELYFAELARLLTPGTLNADALISLSAEYGIRFVEPMPIQGPSSPEQERSAP